VTPLVAASSMDINARMIPPLKNLTEAVEAQVESIKPINSASTIKRARRTKMAIVLSYGGRNIEGHHE
jgi:hypothetical protein